jgi:hypothetical protein
MPSVTLTRVANPAIMVLGIYRVQPGRFLSKIGQRRILYNIRVRNSGLVLFFQHGL